MRQLNVNPWVAVVVGVAIAMDGAALGYDGLVQVFGTALPAVKFGLVITNAGLGFLGIALNITSKTS